MSSITILNSHFCMLSDALLLVSSSSLLSIVIAAAISWLHEIHSLSFSVSNHNCRRSTASAVRRYYMTWPGRGREREIRAGLFRKFPLNRFLNNRTKLGQSLRRAKFLRPSRKSFCECCRPCVCPQIPAALIKKKTLNRPTTCVISNIEKNRYKAAWVSGWVVPLFQLIAEFLIWCHKTRCS